MSLGLGKKFRALEQKIVPGHLEIEPALKRLIEKMPPQPIRDRSAYRKYLSVLKLCLELCESGDCPKKILKAVDDYAKIISLLIGEYERKTFIFPKASQADLLKFLMQQHNLTQADLKKELGGQPAVSNVLNGNRRLNTRQIAKLSLRFGISPATFFPDLANVS